MKNNVLDFAQLDKQQGMLKSDASGHLVRDKLYHVTTKENADAIQKRGFIPRNGISINGKPHPARTYFATSLIAAYDLAANFSSWKNTSEEYDILEVNPEMILDRGYKYDPLFAHGVYVDYAVPRRYITGRIPASSLFNRFHDEDFDKLYQ